MTKNDINTESKFKINKWYLDFICEDGQAMIFYSAELHWHGSKVPYTSFLHYIPNESVKVKSHFGKAHSPISDGNSIRWADSKFSIEGIWQPRAASISERLFESDSGHLDWFCYQPSSDVVLNLNGKEFFGKGYVEMLTLSTYPWKIPMNELRWGRFANGNLVVVWVEILHHKTNKWLWVNGEKSTDFAISDDSIIITDNDIEIRFDKGIILESEKKISNVVEKFTRFIPKFNSIIPANFLMADECKWLSHTETRCGKNYYHDGMAIHEFVDFKPRIL